MFRGQLTMNDPCPVCGLLFEREEGYFFGAMYISYGMSCAFLIAFYLALTALLPHWHSLFVALVAVIPYLPFVPAVFRYSRVLWTYFERTACPGIQSAGSFEKFRQRQLAEQKQAAAAPDRKSHLT
jgi:hypothetical protein